MPDVVEAGDPREWCQCGHQRQHHAPTGAEGACGECVAFRRSHAFNGGRVRRVVEGRGRSERVTWQPAE